MSRQGIEFLEDRIEEAIDYCRNEFDLSYAEVVGLLTIITDTMVREMREAESDE